MRTVMTAAILFLLSLGVASAQLTGRVTFTMDSDFVAGNTTFPRGSYEIVPTADQSVVEIRGAKGSPSAFVEVEALASATPYKQTEIIFNKYAEHMVMKEVMVAGLSSGVMMFTSHAEKIHRTDHGKPTRVRHAAQKA